MTTPDLETLRRRWRELPREWRADVINWLGAEADGANMIASKAAAALLAAEAEAPAESTAAATFAAAWAKKEAAGYQYGRDALEGVRFGWDIAHEELADARAEVERLKEVSLPGKAGDPDFDAAYVEHLLRLRKQLETLRAERDAALRFEVSEERRGRALQALRDWYHESTSGGDDEMFDAILAAMRERRGQEGGGQ